ncbi:hypothetical protein GOB34_11640 [Sinorhizobium meliloti]|nr:hypothetical protein [Sinorhizobium meliloti]MDW9395738.1 hypothetical protein [Sinorhizobium meliloti]
MKWDGCRIALHIESTRVRVLTRGGYGWTERSPTIVDTRGGSWLLPPNTDIAVSGPNDGSAI